MRICDNCGKELRTPIEVYKPFTEIGERSKYEFCSTDCLWQYFAPSNVIQLITMQEMLIKILDNEKIQELLQSEMPLEEAIKELLREIKQAKRTEED